MLEKGIEAFLAIVHAKGLSKAAELLMVTQSTVSHRLTKLEEEMGLILLDRQKGQRGISLTPAGESFFPLAEQWQVLNQEIQKVTSTVPALSLRIGSVDSVNSFILPPVFQYLHSHIPCVHLYIRTYQTVELYEKIERRELDVGFVLQQLRSQYIKLVPFCVEEMLVMRLRTEKIDRMVVSASELDPSQELFIDWGPTYRIWHDKIWDSMNPASIQIDTVLLISKLMKDYSQWALVPASVARNLDCEYYQYQKLLESPPLRTTYMITHKFPKISAKAGLKILMKLSDKLKTEDID